MTINSVPKFLDEKYLSAKEKELIFKSWRSFLKSDCEPDRFTERLYHHISLHCSFIAHYDRSGFIQTYFIDPEDTVKFLSQYDKNQGCVSVEYGGSWWMEGEHSDINEAMIEEFANHKDKLFEVLKKKLIHKKRVEFENAKADYEELLK